MIDNEYVFKGIGVFGVFQRDREDERSRTKEVHILVILRALLRAECGANAAFPATRFTAPQKADFYVIYVASHPGLSYNHTIEP